MEIRIKISDKQVKRLKDFGLGSFLDDFMKDIPGFEQISRPRRFFPKPRMPFRGFGSFPRANLEDKKPLNSEEIKSIEGKARKDLYKEVKVLFETKKRREILELVLERLSPHSLALLIQK